MPPSSISSQPDPTPHHTTSRFIKANNIGADKTCVVVLPDNIRNYMTKHLNDDWMYEVTPALLEPRVKPVTNSLAL